MNPHQIQTGPTRVDAELLAEFNAGVARARMEYAEYPLLRGGWCKPFRGTRGCPECGNRHKSKLNELCWRCIGPKS